MPACDLGVVNYGPEKFSVELREIPKAVCAPDDVLLRVQAVSVCGSDLHMWESTHSWPMNYPVVLGHEFGGVIEAVGQRVRGWKAGDRVVSETAAVVDADGPLARQGLYNLDPTRRGYGAAVDGAMRRWVPVPARILHHVPDNLPIEKAALTEPCCVAYNAVVNNGHVRPGDRVLVLGPGPIGLLSAAVARLQGAIVGIVGLERDLPRLKIAEQYGCTALVGGVEDWSREGDGLGVDGVIDAAGVSATLKLALDLVRP